LKFKELRAKPTARLAEAFQLRKFHDQLLGSGALPMDVIERKMPTWMDETAAIKIRIRFRP